MICKDLKSSHMLIMVVVRLSTILQVPCGMAIRYVGYF